MSETYEGAVIASTEVDAQGEQVDKGFLEDLLLAMGERVPINQKHDQGAPTIGSMSNFRLDERGGHWFLLADLCFDGPPPRIGGMSYTATVATNDGGDGDFRVFLPYAMYKSDGQLLARISDEESVTTGKLIKKAVDPGTVALIVSVSLFLLGPAWQKAYESKVQPVLKRLLGRVRAEAKKLQGRDEQKAIGPVSGGADVSQLVSVEGQRSPVELVFAATDQEPDVVVAAILTGIGEVQGKIDAWLSPEKDIKRISFGFSNGRYSPVSVVYSDGSSRDP